MDDRAEPINSMGAGTFDLLEELDEERDVLVVEDEAAEPDKVLNHIKIPHKIEISLPRGARTIVVSDLHLGMAPTENSTKVAEEIAGVLDGIDGPAAFVIAGDGFEMLAGPPEIETILDAHPNFTERVLAFSQGADHHVIILSGNHDGRVAWDGDIQEVLRRRLGATDLGLVCDINQETSDGVKKVHVTHGNQSDPYNMFEDPFDPVDTPFGHHIVQDVLPEIEARQSPGSLFEGIHFLDGDIADFVGSRLFYRKIVGKIWLISTPFIAVIVMRLLALLPGFSKIVGHSAQRFFLFGGFLVVFMVLVAAVTAVATLMRVNRALQDTAVSMRGDPATHNAPARADAARMIAKGYSGLISGHTHEPEVSVVGQGFYANTGSGTLSVVGRSARLRLPEPFIEVERFSYIEMVGGAELEIKLWLRERPLPSPVILERISQKPQKDDDYELHVAGALPAGPTWPIDKRGLVRNIQRRRVRRAAEVVLLLCAVLNIVFTLLWSHHDTQWFDRWIPFGIHPMTLLEAIVVSIALLGLARGLRRGLRPAWIVTIVVFTITTADRLVVDHWRSSGSVLAILFILWLLAESKHFRTRPQGVRKLFVWISSILLASIAGVVGVGRIVGFGDRPAGGIVGLLILVTVGLLLFSAMPGRDSRRTGKAREEAFARAKRIIEAYGGDTLDYFALRDDKTFFFTGNSLVAYSIINGVMLISPDPIGPAQDRADVWSDVIDFADSRNWSVTVLAASESWLPIYRAAGFIDHYIGDEAIVDAGTFTLQGKSMKSLRGAYNRIEKAGYHVECFINPSQIEDGLKTQLLELMTETRQGESERGFSMTLSRIFDPRDDTLLLAVCFDQDHKPVAFNQYIPATVVDGYSLDLMRRTSDQEAPNGLTDFVIIETLLWMAERDLHGLGLNFATMRAVIAGETGDGSLQQLERTMLHYFSESMQIESLWKFNKKYEPYWNPRYVVTGPFLPIARSSLAIARAEGVTEIPVVGRFLRPKDPNASSASATDSDRP
jgi:lysylphosphatidylglycerol synthetase-like protein (DUF2156 family)/UDP-2,3-diacylglucosamine pyrophosphatase LpxH